MNLQENFQGKTAIVTGAARGIGAAGAKAFAAAGAKVVITDVLGEIEDVAEEIRKNGGEAEALVADITKSENCKALVDLALSSFGRLDFAFNNAGITHTPSPIHELAEDLWNKVIAINLTSVFNCIRYQVPAMLKNGGGVIVNNSSVCGQQPFPGFSPYVAAKHGIIGLTRTAAVEYGAQGIRCVAIGPGYIETEMTDSVYSDEDRAWFMSRIPQGRFGQPEDIAKAVCMLCSDYSCYVNGVYIPVDGAFLLS